MFIKIAYFTRSGTTRRYRPSSVATTASP
uniref:Uncharacterized protein n=1 Tax=Anguilla anguilla TaxID=7936 RepID=A0A0E9U7V2_ANGAN